MEYHYEYLPLFAMVIQIILMQAWQKIQETPRDKLGTKGQYGDAGIGNTDFGVAIFQE